MQIHGAAGGNESLRFPTDDTAARPPLGGTGIIEVEFHDAIRPDLAPGAAGHRPVALTTTSAADLTPLNDLLQRYGLRRAEPSIPTTLAAADQAQATAAARGAVVPHYANLVTLHFAPDADVRQVAEELNRRPEVVRAVPVPVAIPPQIAVADPLLGTSDQLEIDAGTGLEHQWYVFRLHADAAWPIADGAGVVIGDVDWGYRVTHQDLAPGLDMTRAYNAYDGGTNVTSGGSVFHGTGVMGLAGAAQNGVGISGIAPAASLWPIQADSGPGAPIGGNPWATGIEYIRTADSGGRPKVVILEVQTGAYGNYEMVPSVNAAIRTAIASGVVVCVAAGNGNRDASIDDSGSPIPETGSILVAATAYASADNPRASFSNWGDRIVVAAPGDGSHDVTCSSASDTAYRNNFGGTSGATPKVAGTVALMLSANPSLDHATIRDILVSTGSPVTTDPARPAGVFVNTQAAVEEAQRRVGRAVFLTGTPAALSNASGRQQVFVRGRPEAMLSDIFQIGQSAPNNGWTAWIGHGHGVESGPDPAAASNADSRLELFGVAPGRIIHKWESTPGGAWTDWVDLLSATSGTPTLGRNADGRLELFSVWLDGELHHTWQTAPNGGWAPPASLGGTFTFPTARPAAGASLDGRLELFVIATDGTLRHIYQTAPNGGWSAWISHGGGLNGAPPAVSANADGRLELFALGTDNQMYHIWQTAPNGGWSSWAVLAGPALASGGAIGRNVDGRLEVFAIGTDGLLYQVWQTAPNGGWSGWFNSGGPVGGFGAAAPAVSTNADGRLEVYAVANDRDLYHRWQTAPNSGWSAWTTLGRPTL